MVDVQQLADDYHAATTADVLRIHRVAMALAEGIGELGEPRAIESAYAMAGALDRPRLESMLVAALLDLARGKTGTILKARMGRGDTDG